MIVILKTELLRVSTSNNSTYNREEKAWYPQQIVYSNYFVIAINGQYTYLQVHGTKEKVVKISTSSIYSLHTQRYELALHKRVITLVL